MQNVDIWLCSFLSFF